MNQRKWDEMNNKEKKTKIGEVKYDNSDTPLCNKASSVSMTTNSVPLPPPPLFSLLQGREFLHLPQVKNNK